MWFLIVLQTIYKQHFGPETKILNESVRNHVDEQRLRKSLIRRGKLGALSLFVPEGSQNLEFPENAAYVSNLVFNLESIILRYRYLDS